MIKFWIVLSTVIFSLNSCIEKIDFDIKNSETKVVIEALITNAPGPYKVKVSTTSSIYSTDAPPAVNDAEVIVSDNTGITDTLISLGDGIYITSKLHGKVGNTYNLKVKANGSVFESSSIMPYLGRVDSAYFTYYPPSSSHKKGYFLTLTATEPKETKDFYHWRIYRNNKLLNKLDDITSISDEAIQGDENKIEAPYQFEQGDIARIEFYAITKEAYNFYDNLVTNLRNDGGFFGSPPSNPPSNISNGALGLFQVSAVVSVEKVVK